MRTLDDAWIWYEKNRKLLGMMRRLGDRYGEELPWGGRLGNDDHFRSLLGGEVGAMAREVLGEFDDLAIFVMFSVFESIVREQVADQLGPEILELKHPALQRSAAKTLENIAEGSFHANVLELFKRDGREARNQAVNSLVEQVSRVRRYRNWVAHGRKIADRPDQMKPKNVHDTLQAFLNEIRPTS